jgi:hypothetical protein
MLEVLVGANGDATVLLDDLPVRPITRVGLRRDRGGIDLLDGSDRILVSASLDPSEAIRILATERRIFVPILCF